MYHHVPIETKIIKQLEDGFKITQNLNLLVDLTCRNSKLITEILNVKLQGRRWQPHVTWSASCSDCFDIASIFFVCHKQSAHADTDTDTDSAYNSRETTWNPILRIHSNFFYSAHAMLYLPIQDYVITFWGLVVMWQCMTVLIFL